MNSECKATAKAMADLLLDPAAAPPEARAHVGVCEQCRGELQALGGVSALLDGWEAPEPSPYWVARMGVRLREEQAAPPRGWAGLRERLRTRFWVSNHAFRPAAAGAVALVLAMGGGAWMELGLDLGRNAGSPAAVQASNTVRDLQSLDDNAQVFQELSSLDEADGAQAN